MYQVLVGNNSKLPKEVKKKRLLGCEYFISEFFADTTIFFPFSYCLVQQIIIIVYYERLVNITTGMDGKTKTNPMDVTSVTQPVNKEMYVTCN